MQLLRSAAAWILLAALALCAPLVTLAPAVDITITAANVIPGSDATYFDRTAGDTITAGQPVYLDSTDSKLKLADANAASAAAATVKGIALHGAASGQPLKVQTSGSITIGATVTQGTIYVLSATAGGIAPAADLATGHRVTVIGIATSASALKLQINASGVAVP